ncbi:hypothetical protein BKA69DRAFT_1102136 [Paraphysoderma sedebokerense]|nr:hypothetical protein BKA69DRAFT_1102136 [Paraphysoderma sedebokerense]
MASVPFFAYLFLLTLISGGLEASSITNQYIVKLRNSANIQHTKKWIQSRVPMTASSLNKSIPLNDTIKHTFTIGENYKGFSGVFSTSTLEALKHNPDVESITQDYMVHAFAEQKMNTPWGIERISERDFVEDRVYRYPDSAGNGMMCFHRTLGQ